MKKFQFDGWINSVIPMPDCCWIVNTYYSLFSRSVPVFISHNGKMKYLPIGSVGMCNKNNFLSHNYLQEEKWITTEGEITNNEIEAASRINLETSYDYYVVNLKKCGFPLEEDFDSDEHYKANAATVAALALAGLSNFGIIVVEYKTMMAKAISLDYPYYGAKMSLDNSTFMVWRTEAKEHSSEVVIVDNPFF